MSSRLYSRQLCHRCSTLARTYATHASIFRVTPNLPPPYPYGPSYQYKQRDSGLYGNAKIQSGNTVSERNEIKSRRVWRPNIHRKRLWSEALQKFIRLKVQARVLRTIDKVGGLDEYLLGEKSARIKELGVEGWALRWRIMQTKAAMERLGRRREEVGVPVEGYEEKERMERKSALEEARRVATEYVVLRERVDEGKSDTGPISQLAAEVNGVGRQIWLDTQAASIALSLPTSIVKAPLRPLPKPLLPESTPVEEQKLAQIHQTLKQLASQCEYSIPTLLANARTTLNRTRRAEARAQAQAERQDEGAPVAGGKGARKLRPRRRRKAVSSQTETTQTDTSNAAKQTPPVTAKQPGDSKDKAELSNIHPSTEAYAKGRETGTTIWTWAYRSLGKVTGLFGRRK